MLNAWDKNYIYRSAVSPMQRADIFATFREYMSLINNLKEIFKENQMKGLAELSVSEYLKGERLPWQILPATPEDKEHYDDFLNNKPIENADKEAFVSLNLTSPEHQNDGAGILTVPNSYDYFCGGHTLPHRIERYIVAAKKNETLKSLKMIVGGKYVIKYRGKDKKAELMEALKDHNFEMNMMIALDTVSMLKDNISSNDVRQAKTEALATAATAPIENIILDALSLMAEESNKIIRKIMGRRVGSSYLAQAEKEDLLPSALVVQDYLNIRHLLHHQWDTLDSMGKFNENEVIKNASVRRRFLDSYARLCDKPLKERIEAYSSAWRYFLPLVMVLNENMIVKDKKESNSKFLERFKRFEESHKGKTIFVITNHDNDEKKKKLAQVIQGLSSDVQFIDKIDDKNNIKTRKDLVKGYHQRRQFIDIFQNIEYSISQYCLYLGKNYTPNIAWDYIRRGNIINPEESKRWSEYKKIRNGLSHRYMDKELNDSITELMSQFIKDALKLKKEIEKRSPSIHIVKDNVYRAIHANGMVVDIDFGKKKVLKIIMPNGWTKRPVYKKNLKAQKRHIYTEEYANGTRITMDGTDIMACHLSNGITISKEKKYIRYADGVILHLSSPENIYLISSNFEKIIMNKNFKVLQYIQDNKEMEFCKNEHSILRNGHQIHIGVYGEVNKDTWVNKDNKKIQASFRRSNDILYFEYNDGTKVEVRATEVKIFHQGIELTYENRKKFAESYEYTQLNLSQNKKGIEY